MILSIANKWLPVCCLLDSKKADLGVKQKQMNISTQVLDIQRFSKWKEKPVENEKTESNASY